MDEITEQDNGYEGFMTLGRFLESDGWHPKRIEEISGYRVGFQGSSARFDCSAVVLEDLQQLVFYAEAPLRVPQERRMEVARFITLANYGMRIGNFEMDLRDGAVRYKSSLDFEGVILLPKMIGNAIYPAAHTIDEYLPGLTAIVEEGATAEQALARVEGDPG